MNSLTSDTDTKPTWQAPAKLEVLFAKTDGNKFAAINRPTAGPRFERALSIGEKPYQLYSFGTPNGQKIGIVLEELGLEYDEQLVNIMSGDQFSSGFVALNPNSKIPAMLDNSVPNSPVRLFESGSILLYLADKHNKFVPDATETQHRAEVINWLMWQMGSAPYFGQFGHFYKYAPKDKVEAIEYGVARYGMEVQRCLDVLDKQLESTSGFISSWGYSIADMAIYPWVKCLDKFYNAREFLSLDKYNFVNKWVERLDKREQVKKGMQVTQLSKQ